MRLRPSVESAEALDRQLKQADHRAAFQPEMFNWSRTVRGVLGLAAVDLAERLGTSQVAVSRLEQREATGAITVAKLEEVADALDCDLVYGFLPRRPLAVTAGRIQKQQEKARRAKRKIPRPWLDSESI